MSSIVIQGDTSGSITVEAPSVAGTHTLTLPKATGNIATDATVGLGVKNRIINGNMVIDQRNGGASQSVTTSDAYFIDRFIIRAITGSGHTIQQVSDAPNNFNNSAKFTVGTGGSPSSTDRNYLSQRIEGYNFADLAFGTSAAKTITISFWIKSSLTGTFSGSIVNGSSNRSYPFTYTISSANTWEKKSITVAGDVTGTWLTTNGIGSYVYFDLGSGATYQGTSGAWAAADYRAATSTTSVVGTSGATFYITGVQLEEGENATPFENRMYGTELALCQRYAYKLGGEINNYYADSAGGYYDANYIGFGKIRFPVPMRTAPSATFTAGGGINVWRGNTTYTGFSWGITISGNPTTRDCFIVGNKTSHGVTVDAGAMIKFEDTAANCLFSAEL